MAKVEGRSRKFLISGIVFLFLVGVGLEFQYSKTRPNEFWLAVSPYDPSTDSMSHSSESSTAAHAIQGKDAPFCFEISADGEAKRSEACEKNHHFSGRYSGQTSDRTSDQRSDPTNEMPICGWQNLKMAAWDPAVILANSRILSRNIITYSKKVKCRTIILDFENVTGPLTNQFTPKIVELIKELKAIDKQEMQKASEASADNDDVESKARSNFEEPLKVSVAVYAKTHAQGEWDGPRAQDWKLICSMADEITIMAYDYAVPGHGTMSETAPLPWVKSVLKFALGQCDTEQLRLGLAAFGYNWQTGQVISERAYSLLPNPRSEAIMVETARERKMKIELASSLGIHKFLIWSKGQMAQ